MRARRQPADRRLAAGLLAGLFCLTAHAYEESVSVNYYDVGGKSPREIWDGMRANGPTGRDGGRYNATTEWYVSWRYPFAKSADGCATGRVKVTLAITFMLPQWDRPAGAAPAVEDQWERYIEALEGHEEGHADFGRRAAERIEAELAEIAPQPSCEALDLDANALGQQILAEIAPEERAYDRKTNHGATQGTRFFRDLAGR